MASSDSLSSGGIKGSCACGRIKYQTKSTPLSITACHCKTCQQASGGPYLAFADFDREELEWTQKPDVWRSGDVAERGFCRECGSTMSMLYHFEPGRISTTLGTI